MSHMHDLYSSSRSALRFVKWKFTFTQPCKPMVHNRSHFVETTMVITYSLKLSHRQSLVWVTCVGKHLPLGSMKIESKAEFYMLINFKWETGLKKQHAYYYLIRMHLLIIGAKFCDYILYSPKCNPHVERIHYDKNFKCILPTIQDFLDQSFSSRLFSDKIHVDYFSWYY